MAFGIIEAAREVINNLPIAKGTMYFDDTNNAILFDTNDGTRKQYGSNKAKDIIMNDGTTVQNAIATLNINSTEYCKVINGKLYAYNPETQEFDEEVKMGLPTLDYTNYLHIFKASRPANLRDGATFGLTYNVTQDCYLVGDLNPVGTSSGKITIDGLELAVVPSESVGSNRAHQQFRKLSQGDVVVLNGNQDSLYILAEK